jgi:hypothetical protein
MEDRQRQEQSGQALVAIANVITSVNCPVPLAGVAVLPSRSEPLDRESNQPDLWSHWLYRPALPPLHRGLCCC